MRLSLLTLGLLVASGCGLGTDDGPSGDLAAVVTQVDALNTFEEAAEATGLLPELAGAGPYTVFAPNELAFTYLGEARERLLDPAVRPLLARVLRRHVVVGDLTPADLTDGAELQTLEGTPLRVRRHSGRIYVGEAQVDTVAYRATNGRVYEVRSVLRDHLPTIDRLRLSPTADSFLDLLDDAGLLPSLSAEAEPYTLFVPIEDGFVRLGADVVALLNTPANADIRSRLARYHVVPGRLDVLQDGAVLQTLSGRTLAVQANGVNASVGGERVMGPAIETPDGVIYLVARPLMGDLTLDERLRIEPSLAAFNALIRRVPAANAEVTSSAPYTLFAPPGSAYDAAFPFEVRQALLTPEYAYLLERLVRVHLVPGRVTTADLHNGDVLTTVTGVQLPVIVSNGVYSVGGQQIIEGDFLTQTGALHRMGGLIRPPVDLVDACVLGGLFRFLTSLERTGLEATFREDTPRTLLALSDAAYSASPWLGATTVEELRGVILYHTFAGALQLHVPGGYVPLTGPPGRAVIEGGPPGSALIGNSVRDAFYPFEYVGEATNGRLYAVEVAALPPP